MVYWAIATSWQLPRKMDANPGGGGVLSIFVRRGSAIFQGIVFNIVYVFTLVLRMGASKGKQVFWRWLSKHVERGNFVRFSCYLVEFLCFGVFDQLLTNF